MESTHAIKDRGTRADILVESLSRAACLLGVISGQLGERRPLERPDKNPDT